MRIDEETFSQLMENAIDRASLFVVLEGIECICELKAQHLAENWQDEQLAKDWQEAARRIHNCANSRAVLKVS
jgi:hypothetical protein